MFVTWGNAPGLHDPRIRDVYPSTPVFRAQGAPLVRIPLLASTLALVTAALAGCTAEGETLYEYDSSEQGAAMGGANLQDFQDSFEVATRKAHVSFSVGGSGTAEVTIKDDVGQTMYSATITTGGAAASKTMSGGAGTWTIAVDFTNFSGGFALTVKAA